MAPVRVLAASFIGLAVLGPSRDVLAFRPGMQMTGVKATTTERQTLPLVCIAAAVSCGVLIARHLMKYCGATTSTVV